MQKLASTGSMANTSPDVVPSEQPRASDGPPAGAPTAELIEQINDGNKNQGVPESVPRTLEAPDLDENSQDSDGDDVTPAPAISSTSAPLSKNQQKKLLRRQKWAEGAEWRKNRRKEKRVAKRDRDRLAKEQATASTADGSQPVSTPSSVVPKKPHHLRATQVPLTFILDCDFDELMTVKERISLASQLTRAYSDNKNAPFRVSLVVSSYGASLKERFEGVLANSHLSWRHVKFTEEDFVESAAKAGEAMAGQAMPVRSGALTALDAAKPEDRVIYLTSDSKETLTELTPYTTYIIGGIVDKNRHKGLCYKRALDRGVKTARLPIGEYLEMSGRTVLTTNHVVEIMLKWIESGDWGEAFMKVVPGRKGVKLKAADNESDENGTDGEGEGENGKIGGEGKKGDEDGAESEEKGAGASLTTVEDGENLMEAPNDLAPNSEKDVHGRQEKNELLSHC